MLNESDRLEKMFSNECQFCRSLKMVALEGKSGDHQSQ